jgi:hypothetical protein
MPPSTPLPVWKHFTRSADKKSATCNICTQKLILFKIKCLYFRYLFFVRFLSLRERKIANISQPSQTSILFGGFKWLQNVCVAQKANPFDISKKEY